MLSQIFKGSFNFFKKQSTLLGIAKDCLSVLDVPMAPLAHQDLLLFLGFCPPWDPWSSSPQLCDLTCRNVDTMLSPHPHQLSLNWTADPFPLCLFLGSYGGYIVH